MRIVGTKVVLRDWKEEDFLAFRHWMQPGHRWLETDGPYYPSPDTESTERKIESIRRRMAQRPDGPLSPSFVVTTAADDGLIGEVTWRWISQETFWPEVGIDIFGQGLGYAALGHWVQCLFDRLPEIARVDLRTWSGNEAMVRLALKLVFLEEARFRKARIVKGVYFDGLGFGVLREEWSAQFPGGFAA